MSRILSYQAAQKGSLEAAAKDMGRDLKNEAASLEKSAEQKLKQ